MQPQLHSLKQVKYFIYNSYVSMEENIHTEFKGHDCLSVENIDPTEIDQKTLKKTKKPISRTINCFLNTLQGGSIYLGILDSGRVKGLEMSEDQREHFMTNLNDTLTRFDPPIYESDRLRVRFIPVLYLGPNDDPDEAFNSFNKGMKSADLLNHVHLIRTCKPCWCLKNARNQQNAGFSHPAYVIKLTIAPFNMKAHISKCDPLNPSCIPLYCNEEGLTLIRGQASQRTLSLKEIFQKTRHNAKIVARSILEDRKAYLKTLVERCPNAKSSISLTNNSVDIKPLDLSREDAAENIFILNEYEKTSNSSSSSPSFVLPSSIETSIEQGSSTINYKTKSKSSSVYSPSDKGKAPGSYPAEKNDDQLSLPNLDYSVQQPPIRLTDFKPFGIYPGRDFEGRPLKYSSDLHEYPSNKVSSSPTLKNNFRMSNGCSNKLESDKDNNDRLESPPLRVEDTDVADKSFEETQSMSRLQRSLLILSGQSP